MLEHSPTLLLMLVMESLRASIQSDQQYTGAHCGMQVMCALLFLACIAVALPTAGKVFYSRDQLSDGAILHVSHGIAIILIFS